MVVRHATNCGQGSAVRTGLQQALYCVPNLSGVVTADADGQHALADIVRVAEAQSKNPSTPVLGTRKFGDGVPLRSRFGNILTRYVFWFVSGVMITDTQSGLRGIPGALIPAVLRVRANRYEFAVSLLALFCRIGAPPTEVPIATIYLDGNRSSHFKPVRDSVRIYSHLARCFASTLIPAGIDLAGFGMVYALSGRLALAMLAGRLPGIAILMLLETLSTAGKTRKRSLVAHALWLIVTGIFAFVVIQLLAQGAGWNPLFSKIPVEFSLYSLPLLLRLLWLRTRRTKENSVPPETFLSRLLRLGPRQVVPR
jgi:hypothetical protein